MAATVRTTGYTDRLPSPPRIDVPITVLNPGVDDAGPVPVFKPRPDALFDGYHINQDSVNLDWTDWDYNQRRTAQPILPFLFLGPTAVAKDPVFLKSAAITLTVVVRHARQGQFHTLPAAARVASDLGIECAVFDVFDNQALAHNFSSAISVINRHLAALKARNGGTLPNVLVTDDTGSERAAAIVVAYIMDNTNYGLVPAIQYAQKQRFCINLDDALKQTLQAFQDIMQARLDVYRLAPDVESTWRQSGTSTNLSFTQESTDTPRLREKRTLDDMQRDDEGDSGMASSSADMLEAVQARENRGFTPFADG